MNRQSSAVILVGKSILLREGLAEILRLADFRIAASVSCTDDFPLRKPERSNPLLLVLHTGDDFDFAVEQIEFFKESYPGGRVAIVADRYRIGELISAFKAGAQGYFVDITTCDEFVKSMELLMMGEIVFPSAFMSFLITLEGAQAREVIAHGEQGDRSLDTLSSSGAVPVPQLSVREKTVLRCLIEGDSNKSIARKIDVAEATVKVHVKTILHKIGVRNRTQAAIWGINNASAAELRSGSALASVDAGNRNPMPAAAISGIRQVEVTHREPDPRPHRPKEQRDL